MFIRLYSMTFLKKYSYDLEKMNRICTIKNMFI